MARSFSVKIPGPGLSKSICFIVVVIARFPSEINVLEGGAVFGWCFLDRVRHSHHTHGVAIEVDEATAFFGFLLPDAAVEIEVRIVLAPLIALARLEGCLTELGNGD